MTNELHPVPLIRTKLQRPRLPEDLVLRPRLISKLNSGLDRKLTLISAQAGAGKSILLAQWLADAQHGWRSAWLSLDEHDNDLVVFLTYFCETIRTLFPAACDEALDLLRATETPPARVVAAALVNEMNALVQAGSRAPNEGSLSNAVILALDDYQYITQPEIHEMMSGLIAYLPQGVHLALASRTDPPLKLWGLRARRQMTELRTADLRFTPEETLDFLQTALGKAVSSEMTALLAEKCEGWIVGLRLAALSLDTISDDEAFVQGFRATSSAGIVDYLVREVLARQSAEIQEFALRTSIMERFCAPLCEVLTDTPTANCCEMIERIVGANLFLVPLDEEGAWYRYHHLFRDLLQHELRQRYSAAEISEMHVCAGTWFAREGWVDEALHHLMLANDIPAAAELVARHRYALLNRTKWQRLDRYLRLFPPDVLDEYPDLLMLRTWLLHHRSQRTELPAALERLEAALSQASLEPEDVNHLQGEISALRSVLFYHANDPESALAAAQLALEKSPRELWIIRILARLFVAGVLQMGGKSSQAYEAIYQALEEEEIQSDAFKAILVTTVCHIHWLDADLQGMAQAADRGIELSQQTHTPHFVNYGHLHRGQVCYQQNDLAAAERHFAAVQRQPYLSYGDCFVSAACGLALTHQVQGRPDEARRVFEAASAHILETGSTSLMPLVRAFQAELALMQTQIATASQWADRLDPVPPLTPIFGLFSPHLTLVKIWLAQDTDVSRVRAAALLGRVLEYVESTHNIRFLIETLALQALLYDAEGDEAAALAAIERAVTLAEPGGFIRLFIDIGPPRGPSVRRMAGLLRQLHRLEKGTGSATPDYVARILTAFPEGATAQIETAIGPSFRAPSLKDTAQSGVKRLVEPLTPRELEVLALLAGRMTNKEIAQRLVVSHTTVKTHTLNIYRKLDVHTRSQAVMRAGELGILHPRYSGLSVGEATKSEF